RPNQVADLRLEEVPGRQAVREQGVAANRVLERAAAGLADLDVVGNRSDDLERLEDREVARNLLLPPPHDLLLPREPVEVVVGMPEADVCERVATLQQLVA